MFTDSKTFFEPKSIVIIDTLQNDNTSGEIFENLKKCGFKGIIFTIGLPNENQTYNSVLEITEDIDMAIINAEKHIITEIIDQCAQKNVKTILIVSKGYKDLGREGSLAENIILEKIEKFNMNLLGPDSFGFININPEYTVNASKIDVTLDFDKTLFISHSKDIASYILEIFENENIGLSKFISMGDQIQNDMETLLEHVSYNSSFDKIFLTLSTLNNPEKFKKILSAISKEKPVIILNQNPSNIYLDSLLHQSNAIVNNSIIEFLNIAKAVSSSMPKGNKVSVVTNSEEFGSVLKNSISEYANNVTIENISIASDIQQYTNILKDKLQSDTTDIVVAIYKPYGKKDNFESIKNLVGKQINKPLFILLPTGNSSLKVDFPHKIPIYNNCDDIAKVIQKLEQYRKRKETNIYTLSSNRIPDENKSRIEHVIRQCIKDCRNELNSNEALKVLSECDIPVCKSTIVQSYQEAKDFAENANYPFNIKLASKNATLKTDKTNVKVYSSENFEYSYNDLISNILSVNKELIIQEFLIDKIESALEVVYDAKYGYLITFGANNLATKFSQKNLFYLSPLSNADIGGMIHLSENLGFSGGEKSIHIQETVLKIQQLVLDMGFIEKIKVAPLCMSFDTGECKIADACIKIDLLKARKAFPGHCSCGCCD